ncbi:MAG: circularly permuted type 2 ATP-grasp protein [Deltaproteobacteria bacterium]|nr:MAG: circularly permuted type 2 ATP-grasp protein [Deltaproteobacteria bacterium]
MFAERAQPRAPFADPLEVVRAHTPDEYEARQALAEQLLLEAGVTFSVYGDAQGTEKIFPVDLIPRIIAAADWDRVERGLVQRVTALDHFLDDIYADQRILAEGVIPRELVLGASQYLKEVRGVKPVGGRRVHIGGIDLIRDGDGRFLVLEDNVRTPSGVSYVLQNRLLVKRVLPEAFKRAHVRQVDQYPSRLAATLRSVAPVAADDAMVVVLTPGMYNSAYFEHSFLARTMGVPLVEPGDLFVDDDKVWLKTTRGPERVHVVYRRIDEAFLDPTVFRPDSLLGVSGIMRAWAAGNVTLCNAPGNGVADDKAIYPFVPDMIRFYLGEEPILDQVPTWTCARPDERQFVLEHLDELVVKAVDEAGGYGMLMGPQSTAAQREAFAERIKATPRRYIAQRRVELSTCPTWIGDERRLEPRRVDLRPFVLSGADGVWVLPGGLTRVALPRGSYVVNSSQGGGSKDTWALRGATEEGR